MPQKDRVPAKTNNLISEDSTIYIETKTIKNTATLFPSMNNVEYFNLFVIVNIFQNDSRGKVYGKANVPKTVRKIKSLEFSVGSHNL